MEKFDRARLLETERLVLRPHTMEDFEPLAAMFASPHARFVGGPCDREKTWRIFAADVGQWALLGFGPWAIELRESGEIIGQVALSKPLHFPEREIGWLLWQPFEGRGYAFEAAQKAHQFAFQTLGWDAAVSYIAPENHKSISLAKRLGAVHDPDAATPGTDPVLVYRHRPL